MNDRKNECTGCKTVHAALMWFYRPKNGGREYICADEFKKLDKKAQADWKLLG